MAGFLKKHGPSFVGHIIEGQLLALLCCIIAVFGFGWPWRDAYALWGFAAGVLFFYGREKRDCENALDLVSGDPRAYYLLWARPSNVTDLIGNPLVYAGVMAWQHFA